MTHDSLHLRVLHPLLQVLGHRASTVSRGCDEPVGSCEHMSTYEICRMEMHGLAPSIAGAGVAFKR